MATGSTIARLLLKASWRGKLSNRDLGDRRVRVLLEEVPAGQTDDRIWIRADA